MQISVPYKFKSGLEYCKPKLYLYNIYIYNNNNVNICCI